MIWTKTNHLRNRPNQEIIVIWTKTNWVEVRWTLKMEMFIVHTWFNQTNHVMKYYILKLSLNHECIWQKKHNWRKNQVFVIEPWNKVRWNRSYKYEYLVLILYMYTKYIFFYPHNDWKIIRKWPHKIRDGLFTYSNKGFNNLVWENMIYFQL